MKRTFAVAIGGAAGQGVATPGDIFAKSFVRRGLHINAYNAYQSIIRSGHTFLTRAGLEEVRCFGDRIDLLIPLNQDSMDRHLRLITSSYLNLCSILHVCSGGSAQPSIATNNS